MNTKTAESSFGSDSGVIPVVVDEDAAAADHATLKYSLLGPSLTKSGQDSVDQSAVSEVIYNASKGSKFFNHEEERDKNLTSKIEKILVKKRHLEEIDLSKELRAADKLIARLELSRDLTQYIVHVDCDAFYAAVEQLDRPELKDVPFAVGGGVLTTCNYVARNFGCRSGMAGFVAKKLCPKLVLLPLNFEKYNAKAAEVRGVLSEYDACFESASIDEAYLNITEYCIKHEMDPASAVSRMRQEIYEKTSITVSAGIAANTRLAKICSNINKPNGQYSLPHDRAAIMKFMASLPCRKVNGIGRVFERELASVGVESCGDVYHQRQYLSQLFGDKAYEFLIRCYLGLGRTRVQPAEEYERKSVGTESTFRDLMEPSALREKLRKTAGDLEEDMRRAECKGRTLCLKVKLHTFEVLTRQVVLPRAINLADDLYNHALPMLEKLEKDIPGIRLRLMGLRCTHLVSTKPLDTLAFFGLKTRRSGPGTKKPNGADMEDEWERWPDQITDDTDDHCTWNDLPGSRGQGDDDGDGDGDGRSPHRRHGKEVIPNPQKGRSKPEELWECPICQRPQTPDERQFNRHIDICLSRRAILDTVQEQASEHAATNRPPPSDLTTTTKKRIRRATRADPKQKKICFG